jgi:hypothetical protein
VTHDATKTTLLVPDRLEVETFKIEGFKVHFVAQQPLKAKGLQPLTSHFLAHVQFHPDLQSLGAALKSSSHPRQIIVMEREDSTTDMMMLSFARLWPTIIIERNDLRGPGNEKKHCFWKLNAFAVGASLQSIPFQMLRFAFEGLRPGARTRLEFIPWYAARSVWTVETDSTKKLSGVFEDFFSKVSADPVSLADAVEFGKFAQNRAKGRGTFKTKSISATHDGTQVFIVADLLWFNKSEASLRTVYNSLKPLQFDFAVILSPDQNTLQIIARFDLNRNNNRKILMVAGMPGVKIGKMKTEAPKKSGTGKP